jgi:DNA repair exonuclease SbcCD ATPase subunit
MAASKGEQAMNFHLQEIETLSNSLRKREKHVTELENRLRALWDKYDGDRKHYIDRIKRLEEAGNNLLWNFCPEYTSDLTQEQSDALKQWNKAKEAKP